jgi:hypothetical protein
MSVKVAIVYFQTGPRSWVAACPQMGLSAKGRTRDDARLHLDAVMTKHTDFADVRNVSSASTDIAWIHNDVTDGAGNPRPNLISFHPVLQPEISPYLQRGRPEPRSSIVLFVDALGTKAATNRFNRKWIKEKRALLNHARQFLHDHESPYEYLASFTDNVVLAIPTRPGDLAADIGDHIGLTITGIVYYQAQLISQGFLNRGALTVGDIFADSILIDGPGLIEAYELESRSAIFPRIILSNKAFSYVRHNCYSYNNNGSPIGTPWMDELLIDADSMPFVDYLAWIVSEGLGNGVPAEDNIAAHMEGVSVALQRAPLKSDVLEKLRWLLDYHNVVAERYCPGNSDLKFPTDGRIPRVFRTLDLAILPS